MSLEWKWQQENAKLRKENYELQKRIDFLLGIEDTKKEIARIAKEEPPKHRVFTDEIMEFIRENDINYKQASRLAKKYGSVQDALIELVEVRI